MSVEKHQTVEMFIADMKQRGYVVNKKGEFIHVSGLPGYDYVRPLHFHEENHNFQSEGSPGFSQYAKDTGLFFAFKHTRALLEIQGFSKNVAWNRASREFMCHEVTVPCEAFRTARAARMSSEERVQALETKVNQLATFLSERFGYGTRSRKSGGKTVQVDDGEDQVMHALEKLKS